MITFVNSNQNKYYRMGIHFTHQSVMRIISFIFWFKHLIYCYLVFDPVTVDIRDEFVYYYNTKSFQVIRQKLHRKTGFTYSFDLFGTQLPSRNN